MIWENRRISDGIKWSFTATIVALSLAALAEWGSLMMNGMAEWTIPLHKTVKALDYILTPLFAFFLIRQLNRSQKMFYLCVALECVDLVLVTVSWFTGWVFTVDGDNFYQHGKFYILYVIIYGCFYVLCAGSFISYTKSFKKRSMTSLVLICILIIVGMVAQEVLGEDFRISYLVLAIGLVFLYLHYIEFFQQCSDDLVDQQKQLLSTDQLTQLKSRYAYNEDLSSYNMSFVPVDKVVFSLDIDGLKKVNDYLGRAAGDELILAAADIVFRVFSIYGDCYRIGGDEFICIISIGQDDAALLKEKVKSLSSCWRGKYQTELSISVGYACSCEYPDLTMNKLIVKADEMMYEEKHNLNRF